VTIFSNGSHRERAPSHRGGHGHDDDDDDITLGSTSTTSSTTTSAIIGSLGVTAGGVPPFTAVPTSAPPPADESAGVIHLYARCNEREPHHSNVCRAHFTYTSSHAAAVTVPVGPRNYVSLVGQLNAGQPDVFDAVSGEASFLWPCDTQSFIRWTLHDGEQTTSAGLGSVVVACV
jgi:hypothetical protein